jgi:CheY-like chemotaxis protein
MSALAGKRILVVEDEPIVAIALQDILADFGCHVVGPAFRLASALELAASEAIDAAILDVNMGDGFSFGVAELLRARAIPFVFATGYGRAGLDPGFDDAAVLQKPYREFELEAALRALFA